MKWQMTGKEVALNRAEGFLGFSLFFSFCKNINVNMAILQCFRETGPQLVNTEKETCI